MISHDDAVRFLDRKMRETLDLAEYELYEYCRDDLITTADAGAGKMIIAFALRLRDAEAMLAAVIQERDAVIVERDAIIAEIGKAAS
jgi:hypothetical protein